MNWGPVGVCNPDASCVCMNCGNIFDPEEMHADEYEFCAPCGNERAAQIAADRAEADEDLRFHAADPREGF